MHYIITILFTSTSHEWPRVFQIFLLKYYICSFFMHATWHAHLIILPFTTMVVVVRTTIMKLFSMQFCFHYPLVSSLMFKYPFSTIFFNTLNLPHCERPRSQPYGSRVKFIFILIRQISCFLKVSLQNKKCLRFSLICYPQVIRWRILKYSIQILYKWIQLRVFKTALTSNRIVPQ